jgi:hypothetical protein
MSKPAADTVLEELLADDDAKGLLARGLVVQLKANLGRRMRPPWLDLCRSFGSCRSQEASNWTLTRETEDYGLWPCRHGNGDVNFGVMLSR